MIHLDHNATTPVLPEVLEAMLPYFKAEWGNPSSSYKFGSKLKTVIETAREQVADLIGANPREVIFTSCATESNNAAIHAALKANPQKRHIITSAVEHSSVLNYCMALEKENYRVTYLPVDRDGFDTSPVIPLLVRGGEDRFVCFVVKASASRVPSSHSFSRFKIVGDEEAPERHGRAPGAARVGGALERVGQHGIGVTHGDPEFAAGRFLRGTAPAARIVGCAADDDLAPVMPEDQITNPAPDVLQRNMGLRHGHTPDDSTFGPEWIVASGKALP